MWDLGGIYQSETTTTQNGGMIDFEHRDFVDFSCHKNWILHISSDWKEEKSEK